MIKTVKIEYLTPLEFVAMYADEELEEVRKDLECYCQRPLLKIIADIQKVESLDVIHPIIEFAKLVNFEYCYDHDIFYEYKNCPLCLLD